MREGARALNCYTSPLNNAIKTGGKYKGRYIVKKTGFIKYPFKRSST